MPATTQEFLTDMETDASKASSAPPQAPAVPPTPPAAPANPAAYDPSNPTPYVAPEPPKAPDVPKPTTPDDSSNPNRSLVFGGGTKGAIGTVATLADSILKGAMKGREMAQQKQMVRASRMLSGAQSTKDVLDAQVIDLAQRADIKPLLQKQIANPKYQFTPDEQKTLQPYNEALNRSNTLNSIVGQMEKNYLLGSEKPKKGKGKKGDQQQDQPDMSALMNPNATPAEKLSAAMALKEKAGNIVDYKVRAILSQPTPAQDPAKLLSDLQYKYIQQLSSGKVDPGLEKQLEDAKKAMATLPKEQQEKYFNQLITTKDAEGKEHYWKLEMKEGAKPEEVDFAGGTLKPKPATGGSDFWKTVTTKYGPSPTADQIEAERKVWSEQGLHPSVTQGEHETIVYDADNNPHIVKEKTTSTKTYPGQATSGAGTATTTPKAPKVPTTSSNAAETMAIPKPKGMVEPGNLPIWNRPRVENADGTHSSEYSTSFADDQGHEVLVPTVVNGKFLTPDGKKPKEGSPEEKEMGKKAWQHYLDTGENLGKFDNPEDADAYAQKLHNRGEKRPTAATAPKAPAVPKPGAKAVPKAPPVPPDMSSRVSPALPGLHKSSPDETKAKTEWREAVKISSLADDAITNPSPEKDFLLVDNLLHGALGRVNEIEINKIFSTGGWGEAPERWMARVQTGGLDPNLRVQLQEFAHSQVKATQEMMKPIGASGTPPQAPSVPPPGATMQVYGNDGNWYWSDGSKNLGAVQ